MMGDRAASRNRAARPGADVPELPEVESVRRGLEKYLLGRRIDSAESFGERVVRHSPAGLGPVVGRRVTAVRRRGKFLWWELEDLAPGDLALVAHLGMSGQFRVGESPQKHLRARIVFDDGTRLDFIDQRTFGYLAPDELVTAPGGDLSETVPRRVSHIARDLLDPNLDISHLVSVTHAKRSQIKRVLLNQEVVSGIGNIYADEALFEAAIHPEVLACDLSLTQITALYTAAHHVLEKAVEAGGTSFDSLYVNVNGESGYFARSLQAYGRTGEPCPRCGGPIQRIVVGGRSSHFCPHCQRR